MQATWITDHVNINEIRLLTKSMCILTYDDNNNSNKKTDTQPDNINYVDHEVSDKEIPLKRAGKSVHKDIKPSTWPTCCVWHFVVATVDVWMFGRGKKYDEFTQSSK